MNNLTQDEKDWWDRKINRVLRRQDRQTWWMLIRPALIWFGLVILAIVLLATCSRFVAPAGVITIKIDTSGFSDSVEKGRER